MKAVLISMNPKWCAKIANGEKTIEVRKTKPKFETPFKVYIYCTSVKSMPLDEYVKIHRATGGKIDDWHSKVIGEFVCDAIISHCEMANADIAEYQGCIKREYLLQYANGKELYGWHISDLVIYDKPKELSEFRKPEMPTGLRYENDTITKPPQSWCYVEEVELCFL